MEKSENWYKQFTDKLELSGMSPQTQKTYAREIRLLKDHWNKDPAEITEQDVQDYLLMRKNTSKWAPSTLNVALCGIRYYYQLIHKVYREII
jgi:site-specific recombinase XerC